jgi:phosphonate transport system permease protein
VSPEVQRLWRARPLSRAVRISVLALLGLVAWSWLSGELDPGELLSARRVDNLRRFLARDALPYPMQQEGWTWSEVGAWARAVIVERGAEATLATLGISVLAIVLAGTVALAVAPLAARTLMTRDPYLVRPGAGEKPGAFWRAVSGVTRTLLILMRAIPEYVWAFLLLAMLGPNAWPAVVALAIHNSGILGRLGADTVENLDVAPLRSLRMLGAGRRQLAALAVLPLALPRFLLYFFYRFETCVREATVLGMLGVVSLGYWIQEARGRQTYDEMILLVVLGALLVLAADVTSMVARSWVERVR